MENCGTIARLIPTAPPADPPATHHVRAAGGLIVLDRRCVQSINFQASRRAVGREQLSNRRTRSIVVSVRFGGRQSSLVGPTDSRYIIAAYSFRRRPRHGRGGGTNAGYARVTPRRFTFSRPHESGGQRQPRGADAQLSLRTRRQPPKEPLTAPATSRPMGRLPHCLAAKVLYLSGGIRAFPKLREGSGETPSSNSGVPDSNITPVGGEVNPAGHGFVSRDGVDTQYSYFLFRGRGGERTCAESAGWRR